MEIVSILRMLRRHRLLVAAGVATATFVALVVAYQVSFMPPSLSSRQHTSATATARVLIAARTQPAFDLKSQLTDTLGTRAALLADLLSTDAVRARIARGAGLAPGQVAVITPAMGQPMLEMALAVAATEAAATAVEPYVLTVTTQGQLPIISLTAGGPDAVGAAKVANSATASLGELIASRSAGRPDILVERLGPAMTKTLVDGPKKAVAGVAAIVVFSLWCFVIVVGGGLADRWRHRRSPSPAPRYSAST
jgi:hypothetical protein